ncbi:hypothetical protein CFP56_009573 [Quercus suber]|uniref:Uncharacterized protein n=1 Tax=Quercus suber TaxID=58331 RepID=A0AAW0M603_QUESU
MAGGETRSLLVLILIALPILVFAIQSLRTEPSGKEGREYMQGRRLHSFLRQHSYIVIHGLGIG